LGSQGGLISEITLMMRPIELRQIASCTEESHYKSVKVDRESI
jgi:hypothetical protein